MIELVRIDGRLIHGMVAVSWVGHVNPNVMIVVNDRAANDEFEKMTLKLAKPGGVDLYIWSREQAITKLNSKKFDSKKCFVIVGNFEDAEYLVNNVNGINRLNVGPTLSSEQGRVTEGKSVFSDIWVSREEYEILKKIHTKDVEIFAQVSPTVSRSEFAEMKSKFEK